MHTQNSKTNVRHMFREFNKDKSLLNINENNMWKV